MKGGGATPKMALACLGQLSESTCPEDVQKQNQQR